jgi:hypothetical protein
LFPKILAKLLLFPTLKILPFQPSALESFIKIVILINVSDVWESVGVDLGVRFVSFGAGK